MSSTPLGDLWMVSDVFLGRKENDVSFSTKTSLHFSPSCANPAMAVEPVGVPHVGPRVLFGENQTNLCEVPRSHGYCSCF